MFGELSADSFEKATRQTFMVPELGLRTVNCAHTNSASTHTHTYTHTQRDASSAGAPLEKYHRGNITRAHLLPHRDLRVANLREACAQGAGCCQTGLLYSKIGPPRIYLFQFFDGLISCWGASAFCSKIKLYFIQFRGRERRRNACTRCKYTHKYQLK